MTDWRNRFKKYTGHECFVDGHKHDFRPVYNSSDLVKLDKDEFGGHYLDTVYTIEKTYLHHTCTWCGSQRTIDSTTRVTGC